MATISQEKYDYDTETRQVTFKNHVCHNCKGTGKVTHGVSCPLYWKPVRKYAGHKCPHCGAKNKDSHTLIGSETVECYDCKGTGVDIANMYDLMDFSPIMSFIEIKILDGMHSSTFNESYLGIGIIAGCTDYGAYLTRTKGEIPALIQMAKDDLLQHFRSYTQAGNILTPDGKLIDAGYLKTNRDGWSLFTSDTYFHPKK